MPAVVLMRHNPLLKAMSERLLGRGKVKMQVIGASHAEISAFGFWYFKVPKAFRPQLFSRYPLTGQDSIYKSGENVHWNLRLHLKIWLVDTVLTCQGVASK